MKLDLFQRIVLMNQYRILAKLAPNESDWERKIEALENGYENEYDLPEPDVMDPDDMEFVKDVLEMYGALRTSYDLLADKSGIDSRDVRFPGFDGNNETDLLAFARYLWRTERFTDSEKDAPDKGNSHARMRDSYEKKLQVYREVRRGAGLEALSPDAIRKIVTA